MTDPSSILIIRPSALGDVCRSVPVLVSLRERYPNARIDWLVQHEFAPVIEAHPDLSNAIHFHRTEMTRSRFLSPRGPRALRQLARDLRQPGYDLVLDCQGLLRSGLFSWWTRAPRRLTYADAAENAARFATERIDAPASLHTVDRMLALVAAAGADRIADLRLHTPRSDPPPEAARLAGARYLLLAPTSRWPGKLWPADRFFAVARTLLERSLVERVGIVGSASERSQCQPLLDAAEACDGIVDLVGRTSLAQLMALVENAGLVLASDSAPLHMAVGFDRPLVALFGPTRASLVGPYQRERDVVRPAKRPEDVSHKDEAPSRELMAGISIDSVRDACIERLTHPPNEGDSS